MTKRTGILEAILLAGTLVLYPWTDSEAQPAPGSSSSSITGTLGYSSFFVHPQTPTALSGMTGEVSWDFGTAVQSFASKRFRKRHQFTFSGATVLQGDIAAEALALTYGRLYEFEHLFLGFGFAPFTYVLLPRGHPVLEPGYTLDGGPRLAIYFTLGSRLLTTERLAMTFAVKYNVSFERVYWHNPFAPHVHRDMFNSLVLAFGMRGRGT